jgi:hypothetical protein
MKYQNNLEQIVKQLGVNVTENTLKSAFKFHPDYPSLSTLSDVLSEWKVDNLAVKSLHNSYKKSPTPPSHI